ncbi:MAG: maleylpyruvate isomerase family mycothiol-dependent enzyme [Chloroflexi bacterium]|nr:maleylpyruvate isomerase family mycothiol-dependent enzyme [Chloroflexota bacterium]
MTTSEPQRSAREASSIPYIRADEAFALMQTELERLLELLETLHPDDWTRPTACTLWNVRDMIAHQAGGYASGTGYREMIRQYSARPVKGQLPEDAVNALQLRERDGKIPADLIAELRRTGPIAIQKWAYQFRIAKPIAIPHPVCGILQLRHLMWVIHSRDTWMHRLDICRAANRVFYQTRDHDGRIVALVVRDVDAMLRKHLGGRAAVLDLSGIAGGSWKVGAGDVAATIQMDALDFCILVSGRFAYAEGRAKASISGNTALAELILKKALVLF